MPSTLPVSTIESPKFSWTASTAKSSGFNAPRSTKSAIVPGCETVAMSGGLPPSTAVERTVTMLSPPEVYFTVASGFCSVNPSMTAWNDACSGPVQTPITEIDPETASDEPSSVVAAPLPSSSSPPHAPTRSRRASISPRRVKRWSFMRLLSFRHRCRVPSPGRRSGARGCRPRRGSARPCGPSSARRNDRP